MKRAIFSGVMACALAACSGSTEDAPPPPPGPEIGSGHTADSVVLTEIATEADGLKTPRDLAFNPRRPDELWVVNRGDDSAVIITNASTDGRTAERRKDGYALHFMAHPSSIDFGDDETTIGLPGTFATCQESRNTYDDKKPPNDFMGPTLWSSDLSVFAKQNPRGLGSHLDMLHESQFCVGIAHETKNAYWTFSGRLAAIVKEDFMVDHGIGNDDHSDGEVRQYVTGEVKYVPEVPGHLFYRAEDAMLYIADTGNSRIAKLDTKSGTPGDKLFTQEPLSVAVKMDGATLTDVVPADSGELDQPSGLEIHNDLIYVSDHATSRITVFSLEGKKLNYLDTGLPEGSLAGMTFGPDGKLYLVDMVGNRVLRVDQKKK